jgi:hypothetical protein
MTGESVMALVLLLLTAVLGIRHALRVRCLGCCARCPKAGACAKERANTAGQREAQRFS